MVKQSEIKITPEPAIAQAEVVAIAEKELLKYYPDHKRNGIDLVLSKVNPIPGSSDWYVVYGASGATDLQVEMTVDPIKQTVLYFEPHME